MDIHSGLIDRVLRFYVFQQALDCVCFFEDSSLGGGNSTKLPIVTVKKDKTLSDAYGAFSAVCSDISMRHTGDCCYMKLTDDLDLSGKSLVVGNLLVYLNNHTLTVDRIIADNIIFMDGDVKATEIHASFLLALSHASATASVDLFGSELITDTVVPNNTRYNYRAIEERICPQFDSYVDKNLAKYNDVIHKAYQFSTAEIDDLLASIKNELASNMSVYSAAHAPISDTQVVTCEMTAPNAVDFIISRISKCSAVNDVFALKLIPDPLPSVVTMAREVMNNQSKLVPYEAQFTQITNPNIRAVSQYMVLQALKICGAYKDFDINYKSYHNVDELCDYLFNSFLTEHNEHNVFDCTINRKNLDVFSMMDAVDNTTFSVKAQNRIDKEQNSGKWSDSHMLLAKYAISCFEKELA